MDTKKISVLSGMGSLLNIAPKQTFRDVRRKKSRSDLESLQSDWEQVGQSMHTVIVREGAHRTKARRTQGVDGYPPTSETHGRNDKPNTTRTYAASSDNLTG
ncbi:MAG: hypothetical protein GWP50_02750 [Proteobacteria bacterium]|nr:hypothetical protein [Pseudomonadota bacterium]